MIFNKLIQELSSLSELDFCADAGQEERLEEIAESILFKAKLCLNVNDTFYKIIYLVIESFYITVKVYLEGKSDLYKLNEAIDDLITANDELTLDIVGNYYQSNPKYLFIYQV